jgi:hypothetical protein
VPLVVAVALDVRSSGEDRDQAIAETEISHLSDFFYKENTFYFTFSNL